jgi:hypothetical protein
MDDLLVAVLSVIAEALLEFAGELLVSLAGRAVLKLVAGILDLGPVATAVAVVILGTGSGELSLFVFPHPLIHPLRMHGVSLLISPLITGLAMSLIGQQRRRRGKPIVAVESFAYGFTFALAMATVRFVFAK